MKLTYGKTGFILLLLVFCFILIPTKSQAAIDETDYVVENLKVDDVPMDDGSGLVISWKPLPKERRVIEYRVYRGVTPDSLFYIGKIDVNVKTGVPGEKMFFYDTAFNYFCDVQASGKLKREKQQPKDGALFKRYPRDLSVTGPQLKNYDVLGVIPEKQFYYHNRKYEMEVDDETQVYAGLKLRNFSQLAKKLITDNNYYYTVLAVSESRYYYPHTEPAMGTPRENAPEKPTGFYSVFVEDLTKLQFEWSLPIFNDDHYYHSIYMIAKDKLEQFNQYQKELKLKEDNDLAVKIDTTLTPYEITLENPAQLIYRRYSGYPYTASTTASVEIKNNKIKYDKPFKNVFTGKDLEIDWDLDPENIEDYVFAFSYMDQSTYETFSDIAFPEIINSTDLPAIPSLSETDIFKVIDRKNDKGDYNTIMWGKPVVYLTNSSYLNKDKTSIRVNYEVSTNELYKIKQVFFKIYDEKGNQIDYVNEFYQDNKIKIKLPKGSDPEQALLFEMSFKCNIDLPEDYILTQKLVFDTRNKSLSPEKDPINGKNVLKYNNENLFEYFYAVYKNNRSNEEFRLSKKLTGTQRELNDNIRWRGSHFKIVKEFDAKKQLLLVSSGFGLKYDAEEESSIRTNLYLSEVNKTAKEGLIKYQAMRDTAKTEVDIADAEEAIAYYQNLISANDDDPILSKADKIENHTKRIKYLDWERHLISNSFCYKIVKSDGKAHFVESNIYVNEDGIEYFYPKSNWFKTNMLPALIATILFAVLVFIMIHKAKRGDDLYIRPIAGIEEIDNAIGRATEMGRPILFVPGLSGISDVATLAGLAILGRVAKKAAEYDTRILVPVRDYIVLPIAQETVKEAHYEAGRPDTYDKNSVFFITTTQFAFVAGVNGIMMREKTATNFYMGMFWAEALLMTETGNSTGAIQISGTDAVTQIPFFITTCDYTLIGEELYAASAYMAREPLQLGTLKATDYFKFLILVFIILGTVLSSMHLTFLINAFPEK